MSLIEHFISVRNRFNDICAPLETEDYSVQPVEYVSPPKWHLAHTTWFFEQFVLQPLCKGYKVFHPDYAYLFNSYYNNAGERVLRVNRGLMTRPTVADVFAYRNYVTEQVVFFLNHAPTQEMQDIVKLGIQHEQQHQELFYYDIQYILGNQPTFPTIENDLKFEKITSPLSFISVDEGIYTIGHQAEDFCYDNELDVHRVFLEKYAIADRLTTKAEYLDFIEAGGYDDFNLWHADGWDFIQKNNIKAPLYWHSVDGVWHVYNLNGFQPIVPEEPVTHISFYEAAAFAAWKNLRLPTEQEWEVAADRLNWGQVWEWTNSAYLPYPGFSKAPGALGEYNGKFMVNQMVLRGASIATPKNHSRKTYRNFFQPEMRWMFGGIRLAK